MIMNTFVRIVRQYLLIKTKVDKYVTKVEIFAGLSQKMTLKNNPACNLARAFKTYLEVSVMS